MDANDVKENVRNVLNSLKGGILPQKIKNDFHLLVGEILPYRNLGFSNIESYLESIPDVVRRCRNKNGEIVYEAVPSGYTDHLDKLVSSQKSLRKSSAPSKKPSRRPNRNLRNTPPPRLYSTSSNSYKVPKYNSHSSRNPSQSSLQSGSTRQISAQPAVLSGSTRQVSVSKSKLQVQIPNEINYFKSNEQSCSDHRQTFRSPPPPLETYDYSMTQNVNTTNSNVKLKKLTNKETLFEYCTEHKLQKPEFTVIRTKAFYFCSIKVANELFKSYPEEFTTELEAVEAASRNAIDQLKIAKGSNNKLGISEDELTLTSRIEKMVSDKPNGIFNSGIVDEYQKMFCEKLPENWISIISRSEQIKIEKVDESRYIFTPRKNDKDRRMSEASNNTFEDSETESRTSTVSDEQNTSRVFWDVYVSTVKSGHDIHVRLLGESSLKFEELTDQMELYYRDERPRPKNILKGELYVAYSASFWDRVKVLEVYEEKEVALCLFVDNGDEENFLFSDLYVLAPEFLELPFQARHCCLQYLEEFSKNVVMTIVIECCLGKTCVAEVISDDEVPLLCLYDTTTEEDINLNFKIMEQFIKQVEYPVLPKEGVLVQVQISHIEPTGYFYVQMPSDALNLVNALIEYYTSEWDKQTGLDTVDTDELYVAKFSEDNLWYRAKVLRKFGNLQVEVEFIDFGNSEIVELVNMRNFNASSEKLAEIPKQAQLCYLKGLPCNKVEWSPKAINRFKEVAPLNLVYMMKIVSRKSNGSQLSVDLFKVVNGEFVSINATLEVEIGLLNSEEDTVVNGTCENYTNGSDDKLIPSTSGLSKTDTKKEPLASKKPLETSFDKTVLKSVKVPNVNCNVDIHVSFAANPSNFFCQLWRGGEQFDRLMLDLNKFYNDNDNLHPIDQSTVKQGHLYACLHDDHVWYRVQINGVFNGDKEDQTMASVCFIDYGDYALVSVFNLQHLKPEFLNLPKQAIRASLAGIKPMDGDWTPEDSFYFHQLIENKQFVAKILKKNVDESNVEIVHMELIDTSNANIDTYIHKVFVDTCRAVYACEI